MRNAVTTALLGLSLLPGPVLAATFTAGNGADIKDAIPGDGKCSFLPNPPNPNDPGVCTLRAAIMEANADALHDTIVLVDGATYLLTIPGRDEDNAATGDLDIRNPVTIRPPTFWLSGSATIDGNGLDRVFDAFGVHGNGVTLSGITIQGGDYGGNPENRAGGINIHASKAKLSYLHVSTIRGNGIRIYNNVNNEETIVSYSTITGADSLPDDFGYPITVIDALATIESCSLINSHSVGLEIQQSGTEVHLNNSTISGNRLTGISASFGAYVLVSNSTIANNGYGEYNAGSGLKVSILGSLIEVRHSILAGNRINCAASDSGALIMQDNLFDDDSCPHGGGNDLSLVAPAFLSPLGDHGGPTPTHRPMVNSPALDFIAEADCPDDEFDQRLKKRNVAFTGGEARCDLGSVELETDVIFFDPFDRL